MGNLDQPPCERSPAADLAAARQAAWLRDNRAPIDAWNIFVEEHGLPLAGHRQF